MDVLAISALYGIIAVKVDTVVTVYSDIRFQSKLPSYADSGATSENRRFELLCVSRGQRTKYHARSLYNCQVSRPASERRVGT